MKLSFFEPYGIDMRSLLFFFLTLFTPVLSFADGVVKFSQPYTLITATKGHLNITELATISGDRFLHYTTAGGEAGKLLSTEITNIDGLIADIRTARENRDKVFEQPPRPVSDYDSTSGAHETQLSVSGSTFVALQTSGGNEHNYSVAVQYYLHNQQTSLIYVTEKRAPVVPCHKPGKGCRLPYRRPCK